MGSGRVFSLSSLSFSCVNFCVPFYTTLTSLIRLLLFQFRGLLPDGSLSPGWERRTEGGKGRGKVCALVVLKCPLFFSPSVLSIFFSTRTFFYFSFSKKEVFEGERAPLCSLFRRAPLAAAATARSNKAACWWRRRRRGARAKKRSRAFSAVMADRAWRRRRRW